MSDDSALRAAVQAALELLAAAQAEHLADSFPISNKVGQAQEVLRQVAAPDGLDAARQRAERVFPPARRRQIAQAFADYDGQEISGQYPARKP